MNLGLHLGLGTRAGGSVPGFARPVFATTPLFLYQPQTETGVTLSSGQVTAVTGMSSPNMTAPTSGPMEMTDNLGRKFWRFRGSDFLEIAPANLTMTPRAFTVVAMVRQWNSTNLANIYGQSFLTDGVTLDNFNRAFMHSIANAQAAPVIGTDSVPASDISGGLAGGVVGSQPQVVGVSCNGSRTRLMINDWAGNGGVNGNFNTDMKGARIGGYAKSNGTSNYFDVYAIAGFSGTLTDGQADAAQATLVSAYSIAPTTRQVYVEGDSLNAASAIGLFPNVAMLLSAPGAGFVPAGTRVVGLASSGSTSTDILARLTATNGWAFTSLPGGAANNLVAFQIGVNDQGVRTAAAVVTNIESYLATAVTGAFARGFNARLGINIASANGTLETFLEQIRVLLRAPAFLTNIGAQSGGPNEGRIQFIDLEQISVASDLPFEAPINAAFYEADGLHPSLTGAAATVSGGDTPANGWGAVI